MDRRDCIKRSCNDRIMDKKILKRYERQYTSDFGGPAGMPQYAYFSPEAYDRYHEGYWYLDINGDPILVTLISRHADGVGNKEVSGWEDLIYLGETWCPMKHIKNIRRMK